MGPGMGVKTSFAYINENGIVSTGPRAFWEFLYKFEKLVAVSGYTQLLKENPAVGWRKRFPILFKQARAIFGAGAIGEVHKIKGCNNATNPSFTPYLRASGAKPPGRKPLPRGALHV